MDARPDCEACGRALVNPYCGLFQVGCAQCQLRHTARAPKHVRDSVMADIPFDERAGYTQQLRDEYRRLRSAIKEARK